jgi:hypothetical protein
VLPGSAACSSTVSARSVQTDVGLCVLLLFLMLYYFEKSQVIQLIKKRHNCLYLLPADTTDPLQRLAN